MVEQTRRSSAERSLPTFLSRNHAGSWSADLEQERYADDRELLVEHSLLAIEQTKQQHHVNLVTHPAHGNPDAYLAEPIVEQFPDAEMELVDQCGCGGYVYRVQR